MSQNWGYALLLLAVNVLFVSQVCASAGEFVLPNFPYHRQDTEWWCGEASLQMVLEFFSQRTIPQDLIASVARASEYAGTRSYDMQRALAFSRMSWPAAPNASVDWHATGYPGADIGMAARVYTGKQPWMSELREVVKRGFPVVVLQQFAFDDAGGHYRVVYGFNDTHIYMKDPWGRDATPRDMRLSNEDFVSLWRYAEFVTDGPRYTGIAGSPWSLLPQAQGTFGFGRKMKIRLGFTNVDPFFKLLPTASTNTFTPILELRYDQSIFNETRSVIISDVPVYEGSDSVYFEANCAAPIISDCFRTVISARISGIVQGSVATAPKTESELYPAYDYADLIGSPWSKVTILSSYGPLQPS